MKMDHIEIYYMLGRFGTERMQMNGNSIEDNVTMHWFYKYDKLNLEPYVMTKEKEQSAYERYLVRREIILEGKRT